MEAKEKVNLRAQAVPSTKPELSSRSASTRKLRSTSHLRNDKEAARTLHGGVAFHTAGKMVNGRMVGGSRGAGKRTPGLIELSSKGFDPNAQW